MITRYQGPMTREVSDLMTDPQLRRMRAFAEAARAAQAAIDALGAGPPTPNYHKHRDVRCVDCATLLWPVVTCMMNSASICRIREVATCPTCRSK